MPITKQHELPIRAAVTFWDGDTKTCALRNDEEARDWLDRQMFKYGSHIMGSDIFPNKFS